MRAAVYMRVGNPGQLSDGYTAKTPAGEIRNIKGDSSQNGICAGSDIPNLQEFLQEIRAYDRHSNLTIIHHQF